MNNINKNLDRITTTIETDLLEKVQAHRLKLVELTGLRVSISQTVSALVKSGLEVSSQKANQ